MKKLFVLVSVFVLLIFSHSNVSAATYQFDKVHSTIGFAVKHLLVATTRGQFTDYTGSVAFDEDNLKSFEAEIVIQVKSIDTANTDRDNHLRSPEFFDVSSFPEITFKSTRLTGRNGQYKMTGDLTIRDVSKRITIPVTIFGPVKSPFGFTAIGISGEAVINRQDFGVSWSKTLDSGGLVVGDKVTLMIEIEAHAK